MTNWLKLRAVAHWPRWTYNFHMKRTRKAVVDLSEPSAAQIARMSGISVSRVYRLLSEGRTGAQIVAQAQRRKEEAALNVLPTTPVANGHAADISFSAAQTQKEIWTGKLRELEYMERCGTLVPNSYVRHWGTGFCIAIRDEMRKASELRDVLASESNPAQIQTILDNWVSRVLDRIHSLESLWAPSPKETM
jgi:hypothetical protein